jgi:hypothetical protein
MNHMIGKCFGLFLMVLMALSLPSQAKVIVVNTTNPVAGGFGQTNLATAITLLQDSDCIHFDIPGDGPFYLQTPPLTPDNGYPAITAHNVTIDGYTQPGASPNTSAILSSNNAVLQIVIDSRGGGLTAANAQEAAAFLILGATNVTLRGLCILGPGFGSGTSDDPYTGAILMANGASHTRIQGCRIGLDLDGTSVYPFVYGIGGFEFPTSVFVNSTVIGVEKTASSSSVARSQFNIIAGLYIPVLLEGDDYRICGNFFNVFPDGLRDYQIDGTYPRLMQAFVEIGRRGNKVVIGTDGDGHNDSDERNIFGGVTQTADGELFKWYGNQHTNIVIAGNYIGMAVDGLTRFTNSSKLMTLLTDGDARLGSDFDGVSDLEEGNVISMHHPFAAIKDDLIAKGLPPFAKADHFRLSVRGNRFFGSSLAPFTYANGRNDLLMAFTGYCAPYMEGSQLIPILNTNCSQARIQGTCASGVSPYTNIIIDLYLADRESWTNGQTFEYPELKYQDSMGNDNYHGFAVGGLWLASFVDNGPADADPVIGAFDFPISALNLPAEALVTVSANYSADPPGTHNGRMHTSNFSLPVSLLPTLTLAAWQSAGKMFLSWPTNAGTFAIQTSTNLKSPLWTDLSPQPVIITAETNFQCSVDLKPGISFFRLMR